MRFLIIASFILAACKADIPPANPDHASCGASGYQTLIGQSADILAAMTFPAPMRVIKPGMAITMDFNPARLNMDLDANNRIARVWCG